MLFRFALSSMDMEQRDYDSRTALHVAAAEGKNNLNNKTQVNIQWNSQFLAVPGGLFMLHCSETV